MKRPLSVQIGNMRRFWIFVCSYYEFFAVNRYGRAVSMPSLMHAKKSRFAIFIVASEILLIAIRRDISKIRESIVGSASINMVNTVLWPFAGHVQPNQSVGKVGFPKNTDMNVSGILKATCHLPDVQATGYFFFPGKNAGFAVISERVSQFFKRNNRCTHDIYFTPLHNYRWR